MVQSRSCGKDSAAPRKFTAVQMTHRGSVAWRIAWMVVSLVTVQAVVCGAALLPVVLAWSELLAWTSGSTGLRLLAVSLAAVPSYAAFAVLLMFASALAGRALRWHTPPDAELRIADVDWALLQWARCMAATHVVRLLAGGLFRGTPIWTAYLRLAGARLGRRVYVNSLGLADYNLLEFNDDVVIGGEAHLSGHTVEGGVLRTARIRLGRGVTVGLGSVLEIGVEAGDRCQIGALSFVPKHSRLEGGATYAGIPVRRLG